MNDRTALGRTFPATRWSLVRRAGASSVELSTQALEELCRMYWLPLYAFARREGKSPADAEDLTQGFLANLLRRGDFAKTSAEYGSLRSFLLAAFKNFIINEWKKARRLKRGGPDATVSIDQIEAEERYQSFAADTLAPDRLFDRAWAVALLDGVLQALRQRYRAAGKEELFDQIKGVLGGGGVPPYDQVARAFDLTEGAVKTLVYRLKREYRDALKQTVADSLMEGGDPEAELQGLLAAL